MKFSSRIETKLLILYPKRVMEHLSKIRYERDYKRLSESARSRCVHRSSEVKEEGCKRLKFDDFNEVR